MAEKSIMIIGGGGHTSSLIGVLKRNGAAIEGIVTSDHTLVGGEVHGIPILGLEEFYKIDSNAVDIVNGVGNKATRDGPRLEPRAAVYHRYTTTGFTVLPVISGQAILQPDINLGHGVQIMPGVIVQAGAMIGDNVILNTGAIIDHDAVVAPNAHIAPGAVLCGGVSVGALSHIGAGAVILQNVKIGSNVLIAAGVVVGRNVPDGSVVVG